MPQGKVKYLTTVRNIPDDLWDINLLLPSEKPNNTIGRPLIPFGKVLDRILHVLRTGCRWKMLPNEHGSDSTCHRGWSKKLLEDLFQTS
jgi:transposase